MHEGEQVLLLPVDEGVIVKHPSSSLRGRLRGRIDLKGFEEDTRRNPKQMEVMNCLWRELAS